MTPTQHLFPTPAPRSVTLHAIASTSVDAGPAPIVATGAEPVGNAIDSAQPSAGFAHLMPRCEELGVSDRFNPSILWAVRSPWIMGVRGSRSQAPQNLSLCKRRSVAQLAALLQVAYGYDTNASLCNQ